MSKKKTRIAVMHLNGCDRCAWHMLAVADWTRTELVYHSFTSNGNIAEVDYDTLVITGYALSSDLERVKAAAKGASRIIAYGTCPVTGGIFGLINQKGGDVIPLRSKIDFNHMIMGCPPAETMLQDALEKDSIPKMDSLCRTCNRTLTQGLIQSIGRLSEIDDTESCFNNLGIPCNGVVSGTCIQKCIDFNVPCRGCVPNTPTPSEGMIGYFGSLASECSVDTMATAWTTDMLGDNPDDITEGLRDVVGTFFRFNLADAFKYKGKQKSTGDTLSDIMIGRHLEEAPQIAATIYGTRGIAASLALIQAYEAAANIEPSEPIKEMRNRLLETQKELLSATSDPSFKAFDEARKIIREIAGNEVMSNMYFGGFRAPISTQKHSFESYAASPIEIGSITGEYDNGICKLSFGTDEKGIIREWSCEF